MHLMCCWWTLSGNKVKGQSAKRQDSLVKSVLRRSLHASQAVSPAVVDSKRSATPTLSATAVTDDGDRKPLRSILHNSVSAEHLHETDSDSNKTDSRCSIMLQVLSTCRLMLYRQASLQAAGL